MSSESAMKGDIESEGAKYISIVKNNNCIQSEFASFANGKNCRHIPRKNRTIFHFFPPPSPPFDDPGSAFIHFLARSQHLVA